MRYKVTAIKPVELLVKMRREDAHPHPGKPVAPAGGNFEWIFLNAGEVRDGVDLVLGVLASYIPNQPSQLRLDRQTVLLPLNDKLPKVYHELFEVEASAIPD
jgi:hypothetical protein